MGHKFPSAPWVANMVEELNNSPAYAEAAKAWEGDVLLVVEGEGAAYLDLWHGHCRQGEFLDDPAGVKAEYTLTASKDNWRKILERRLDPMQAMMTRQVKLEGNMVKAMQNMKAAQELVRCATRVETEY